MHRLVFASLLSGLILSTTACGGPSDPAPGPLGRKFEDSFLASVPIDQRKEEIEAKQAYDISALEKGKAAADFNESRVQLDVARNERDAARLDERSAASRAKAAAQSADQNRIKEADKETQGAKLSREASEKRYAYIDAYRKWLKRLMRYSEHNMFWKESQYELAQARLAQKNTIQPKGFNLDNFVKQEGERARKVTDYKRVTDGDRKTAESARTSWLALQASADKVLGRKSQFPDPMSPQQVKGVDPNMGAGGYTPGADGGNASDDEVQPVQDPTKESDGSEDDGGGSSEP